MLLSVQTGTISVHALGGGSVWVVALIGEHDHSTNKLRAEQTRRVWPPDARIVIDLSGATFIDSSVITWLLRMRRALAATGHPAVGVVAGPPDRPTARVLDLLSPKLRRTLGCCRTLGEALAEQPPSAPAVAHRTLMTVQPPSAAPADVELARAFDRVGLRAWKLAAWIVDDPDLADEIVVDTFTQLAGNRAPTDDTKLLHDVQRRSVATIQTRDATTTTRGRPDPGTTTPTNVEAAIVRSTLASLPERQRTVIELATIGGLSITAISTATAIPRTDVPALVTEGLRAITLALVLRSH